MLTLRLARSPPQTDLYLHTLVCTCAHALAHPHTHSLCHTEQMGKHMHGLTSCSRGRASATLYICRNVLKVGSERRHRAVDMLINGLRLNILLEYTEGNNNIRLALQYTGRKCYEENKYQ